MSSRFETALQDVGKVFDTPEAVAAARDLSDQQKVRLLQEWEYDLRLLMVASEENMTGDQTGSSVLLFGRVRKCLNELGVYPDEEQGVGPKTG